MENNKQFNELSQKVLCFEANSEQSIESEVNLPDYFPDIVKLVKCTLTPNILSVNVSEHKIMTEGSALISVLYLSDDGNLHCFEQRQAFSKALDNRNMDNCVFDVNAKTEYINCRVASQRKMDIHASVNFNFKAYDRVTAKVVSQSEDSTIQTRTYPISFSNLLDFNIKYFTLNETVQVGSAQNSIAQIVKSDARVSVESIKSVKGKMLIKGSLLIDVLYLSENDFTLQRIENSIPLSQIIEASTTDESLNHVDLTVFGLEVYAKTDSSGALRLIDVTANIKALINVYENKNLDLIDDIYSTKYNLTETRKELGIIKLVDEIQDNFLTRATLNFDDFQISSVLNSSVENIDYTNITENDTVVTKGSVKLNFLVEDTQQLVHSVDKSIDFEYRSKSENNDCLSCESKLVFGGMSYILQNENAVDIKAEFIVQELIFSTLRQNFVTDFQIDDGDVKEKTNAALVIYFSDEGESLWSIAKRYNTTVKSIKEENKLEEDILTQKTKLLIPSI